MGAPGPLHLGTGESTLSSHLCAENARYAECSGWRNPRERHIATRGRRAQRGPDETTPLRRQDSPATTPCLPVPRTNLFPAAWKMVSESGCRKRLARSAEQNSTGMPLRKNMRRRETKSFLPLSTFQENFPSAKSCAACSRLAGLPRSRQ